MKEVFITRQQSTENETLGSLAFTPEAGGLFECKTLELPWLENKAGLSCIPIGKYECNYTRSSRLSLEAEKNYLKSYGTPSAKRINVFTYELLNVPGRVGIRIHSANYFFQLLGCIALGSLLKDLNADQQLDVIHSGNTLRAFEA